MLTKMANTKNGIITYNDWLVYDSQALIPLIELGYIDRGIEVRIKRISTSLTLNKTSMSGSIDVMTPTASLGRVSGIDIDNSNSFHRGFIFDKTLELSAKPICEPTYCI